MSASDKVRVLVVDDNRAIHQDFAKILKPVVEDSAGLDAMEQELFGESSIIGDSSSAAIMNIELADAFQGQEALAMVETALQEGRPYALAFVDMRMPPGWDGLETIKRMWKADSRLQIVICSAYSDHDWSDMIKELGTTDRLLILKKPFESVEVLQCATAMTEKWKTERVAERHLQDLEARVEERTRHLVEARSALESEMQRREQAEVELRLAQKLEAVGRLASGIAHEINTPIQYIGDSVHFLKDAFGELSVTLRAQRDAMTDKNAVADLDFLEAEVPKAIDRTLDGVERVAGIVRAMKEFAHSDGGEQAAADINRAIESTLMVANNEYKYVATVTTALGDIPFVVCFASELKQVLLNMVVNAAHALSDAGRDASSGAIRLATSQAGDFVEIAIEDNGCGIPQENLDKIFDPFFTTKEVGRGSGQGLALARSVIDRHAGTIKVSSEPGKGTKFVLRLPIAGKEGHDQKTAVR